MAKKSIAKNYLYNLVYQVLILVLPIITTPYISRTLGATNIGIYSYTYSILSYFLLFGALGVAMYGQREIAYIAEKKEERKKVFWEIVSFRAITMLFAICVYAIFFMVSNKYSIYYRIWCLELVATAVDISWFFQGIEEFKKTVIRNVLVRIISVALIFILVKNGQDLIKYITIYAIADLVGNLSLWAYLPKYFKGVKVKSIELKKHIMPIVFLFIPQISGQVYNMLDKTMIGRMIEDKSEVGFYEEAIKVIRVLVTIVSSLGIVMVSRMANVFATGDKEKLKEYLKKSLKFTFLLGVPMSFGVAAVAKAFVPIFLGGGFDKTIILMEILSPIVIRCGMSSVIGYQYLLPVKRQKEYTLSIVVGIIINFLLNYILILKYNSIGASVATVVSQLAVCFIQVYIIRKDLGAREIVKDNYKYIVSGTIMFLICIFIKSTWGANLKTMIIQILIGMISYVVCLLVLRDKYFKELLFRIKLILESRRKR